MKLFLSFISAVLIASGPAIGEIKPADNTARNARDRSGQSLTPQDQSNNPGDLELSKNIRQAVVKDSSLSSTAKNVKIISTEGKVTLRGPVNSHEEKMRIGRAAIDKAGATNVDNQLEVKGSR
jgi:hyperosmotically inducible periplasmic protein